MNKTTLNNIVAIFKSIANRHYQINDFGYGPTYQIRDMKYPYLWVTFQPSTLELNPRNKITENKINLTLILADLLNNIKSDNYDEERNNALEVSSDINQILYDIVEEINSHPYYVENNISIKNNISYSPSFDAKDDRVNAITADIVLTLPFNHNWCENPIDYTTLSSVPVEPCKTKIYFNNNFMGTVFASDFVNFNILNSSGNETGEKTNNNTWTVPDIGGTASAVLIFDNNIIDSLNIPSGSTATFSIDCSTLVNAVRVTSTSLSHQHLGTFIYVEDLNSRPKYEKIDDNERIIYYNGIRWVLEKIGDHQHLANIGSEDYPWEAEWSDAFLSMVQANIGNYCMNGGDAQNVLINNNNEGSINNAYDVDIQLTDDNGVLTPDNISITENTINIQVIPVRTQLISFDISENTDTYIKVATSLYESTINTIDDGGLDNLIISINSATVSVPFQIETGDEIMLNYDISTSDTVVNLTGTYSV